MYFILLLILFQGVRCQFAFKEQFMEQFMKSENHKEKEKNIISDRPIENANEDKLGWDKIAKRLADTITDENQTGSLVLGISGSWGSGKTSMLNLTKKHLKENPECTTIEYNPWLKPESDYIKDFFTLFVNSLNPNEDEEKKLQKTMSLLAKSTGSLLSLIGNELKWVIGLLVALGFGTAIYQYETASLTFAVIVILGILGRIGYAILDYCNKKNRKSLSELKDQISEELEYVGRKFVILIDDIDRLPPNNICSIFQLVKNNGNLPNVNYILSYDADVIKDVLEEEYIDRYRSFDEKIVQIQFTLPAIDKSVLDKYYKDSIEMVLKKMPQDEADKYWDSNVWSNYFLFHIREWYNSFRDVKQLVNGYYLGTLFLNRDSIEVNPIEHIVIEHIRILWPNLFKYLKENKNTLLPVSAKRQMFGNNDNQHKSDMEQYNNQIKLLDSKYQKNVDEILKELFPNLKSTSNDYYESDQDKVSNMAKLRICSEEIFDRYFVFGNYTGDVSNKDLAEITKFVFGDESKLIKKLNEFPERDRLIRIIDIIIDELLDEDKTGRNVQYLVPLVYAASDLFTQDEGYLSEIHIVDRITIWVKKLLKIVPSNQRFNILSEYIKNGIGIFGPVISIEIMDRSLKENENKKQEILLDKDQLDKLKTMAKQKLLNWQKSANALDHIHFTTIYYIMARWYDDNDKTAAYNDLIGSEKDFKIFISRFRIRSQTEDTEGKLKGVATYSFNFKSIDTLFDINEINRRMQNLTVNEDDIPEFKQAYKLFFDGIKQYLNKRNV